MKRGKNELPSRDVAFFCTIALSGDGMATYHTLTQRVLGLVCASGELFHQCLPIQ